MNVFRRTMRPELTREQRKQTGAARAKMFIKANLGWLDGFPVGQTRGRVTWQLRPRVQASSANLVTIDRNVLTCAEVTVAKLVRHFPFALPELIGDVFVWQQQVHDVIDRMKRAVHQGVSVLTDDAVPTSQMHHRDHERLRQIVTRHRNLRPVVRAILWSQATRDAARGAFLDWLEEHASWLERFVDIATARGEDPLPTILLLADVARHDGPALTNIGRFVLGDSELFDLASYGLVATAKQYGKELNDWAERYSPPKKPTLPATRVGPAIVQHIHWIANQNRVTRRHATDLTKAIVQPSVLEAWRNAWRTFQEVARFAMRDGCDRTKNGSSPEFFAMVGEVVETLTTQFDSEPMPFLCAEVLPRVARLVERCSPAFCQALERFLLAIPLQADDGTLDERAWVLRLLTLDFEYRRHDSDSEYERRWVRYFTLATDFLNSTPDKELRLRPWKSAIRRGLDGHSEYRSLPWALRYELPRIEKWPSFFRALAQVVSDENYNDYQHDLLAYLVAASADEDQAAQRFRQLLPLPRLFEFSSRQVAAALALEGDGFSLTETIEFVRQQNDWDVTTCEAVIELHEAFKAAGWPALIPHRLRLKRRAELARIATQYRMLAAKNLAPTITAFPDSPPAPAWLAEFPPKLQAALSRLAAVAPDAQSRAERLLAKRCRTTNEIQRELAVLEKLAQQFPERPELARRLANLRARIGRPATVAGRTLEKTLAAIDELVRNCVLEKLATSVEGEMLRQVGVDLGASLQVGTASVSLDDLSLQPRHVALLRGILEQKEPYRTYGLRLLRKEWCGVRWDLEWEPQNQKFLQRLAASGVRVGPWFEPRATRIVAPRGDRAITLAFETNAVEQMLMGYYFDTCLSPHDFNFFSAIVNAVDVNKRVLFARDDDGNVVGRCLLAIGDAGTLLTFRPYCQDADFALAPSVAEFADRLAAEMGTIVSHKDRVSPLLAPTWYDDGAHDLGGELTKEGSAVRKILATATPDSAWMDELVTALHPVPLAANSLALIVDLPEMQERPALIEPLLRLIENSNQTTLATKSTAMQLADRAGLFAPAARLANAIARQWLTQKNCRRGLLDDADGDDLKTLVRHAPSLALRVLRATRPPGVRADREEQNPQRRERIAECLKSLGRLSQAQQIENAK